jgi:hypothetical protein
MSQTFYIPKGKAANMVAKLTAFVGMLSPMKAWRIEITEAKSQRSIQQLRYLWGVAYKRLSDFTGYEVDDVSEFMCGTYYGWREVKVPKTPTNPTGLASRPVRTTTTDENGKRSVISKMEFMDYVAFVQRFAASKGVYIPDPDEMEEDERVAA